MMMRHAHSRLTYDRNGLYSSGPSAPACTTIWQAAINYNCTVQLVPSQKYHHEELWVINAHHQCLQDQTTRLQHPCAQRATIRDSHEPLSMDNLHSLLRSSETCPEESTSGLRRQFGQFRQPRPMARPDRAQMPGRSDKPINSSSRLASRSRPSGTVRCRGHECLQYKCEKEVAWNAKHPCSTSLVYHRLAPLLPLPVHACALWSGGPRAHQPRQAR